MHRMFIPAMAGILGLIGLVAVSASYSGRAACPAPSPTSVEGLLAPCLQQAATSPQTLADMSTRRVVR